jgi:hypothetical protein
LFCFSSFPYLIIGCCIFLRLFGSSNTKFKTKNKTKQNKTKQNKTKQNKKKQLSAIP